MDNQPLSDLLIVGSLFKPFTNGESSNHHRWGHIFRSVLVVVCKWFHRPCVRELCPQLLCRDLYTLLRFLTIYLLILVKKRKPIDIRTSFFMSWSLSILLACENKWLNQSAFGSVVMASYHKIWFVELSLSEYVMN